MAFCYYLHFKVDDMDNIRLHSILAVRKHGWSGGQRWRIWQAILPANFTPSAQRSAQHARLSRQSGGALSEDY